MKATGQNRPVGIGDVVTVGGLRPIQGIVKVAVGDLLMVQLADGSHLHGIDSWRPVTRSLVQRITGGQ